MKSFNSQNGSAHIIIVIVAFLAVLGAVGFVAWNQITKMAVASYEDCLSTKDGVTNMTYPETCTAAGKTFTNPNNNSNKMDDLAQTFNEKNISFKYPNGWTIVKKDDAREDDISIEVKNASGENVAQLITGGQYGGACPDTNPSVTSDRHVVTPLKNNGTAEPAYFAYTIIKDTDQKYRIAYGLTKENADASESVKCPMQTINYQYVVTAKNDNASSVVFSKWIDSSDAGFASESAAKEYITSSDYMQSKKMIESLEIK